jgi:dinuclear metal center YbgI/SA1388 family protein
MLELPTLSRYLNELLPSQGLSDSCVNGLQVEGKAHIRQLATAVSANLATIEEAVKRGVDVLIVHHGLFWLRDSYVIQGTKRKKLFRLLENGISLFAYHLPLDKHTEIGNNWKVAKDLDWKDLQPFGDFNGVPIGVKGKIAPCTRSEFKTLLENYYGHPATCAWGGPERIQTVGLVSGGAYKLVMEASQQRLDAFITGNFDEPVWYQTKEEECNFYALGHHATERVGPIALADRLEQTFHLPCYFLDIENPF